MTDKCFQHAIALRLRRNQVIKNTTKALTVIKREVNEISQHMRLVYRVNIERSDDKEAQKMNHIKKNQTLETNPFRRGKYKQVYRPGYNEVDRCIG